MDPISEAVLLTSWLTQRDHKDATGLATPSGDECGDWVGDIGGLDQKLTLILDGIAHRLSC